MKAGLAACMLAVKNAKQKNLRGDVILTAVMDEEYAGLGTMDIAKRYRADAAIVAEFTEMNLILAHKGFVWLDVETTGVAAHGSRPELGVDAIAKMGAMLVELEKLDQTLRSHPTHKWLGSGSLHASLINGGRELSSYPDRCQLSIERRTLPGETPEMIEAEVQEIIKRLQSMDPAFKAQVRRGIDRPPMETPEDSPIVKVVKGSVEKVLKHAPEITGVPFWTDAATLWAAGIPSYSGHRALEHTQSKNGWIYRAWMIVPGSIWRQPLNFAGEIIERGFRGSNRFALILKNYLLYPTRH